MASTGIFYLKNAICKEMPSRVAGRYLNQVGGDFCQQPATFDNPAFVRPKKTPALQGRSEIQFLTSKSSKSDGLRGKGPLKTLQKSQHQASKVKTQTPVIHIVNFHIFK